MDVSTPWVDPNVPVDTKELVKPWDGSRKAVSAAQVFKSVEVTQSPVVASPSASFYGLLEELGNLHALKNQDYGREHDPYANVRGSQEWGVQPWVGAMVRANDKMKRLQKAAQGGTLANEGVEDSLLDLAVYAMIGLILYREARSDARR
jgi:hypothetical protein